MKRTELKSVRCSNCNKDFLQKSPHQFYCGSIKDKIGCSYIKNISSRKSKKLFRLYGINLEQYQTLLKIQFDRCAICKEKKDETLQVDHSHSTGKIRGLLCHSCNTAIGLMKDNKNLLNNAINYLG